MNCSIRCTLIALGNGKGCRVTEEWLTESIKNNYFAPLDVSYTIVAEEGASIYSCSTEAKKEFGKLDPNIIGASTHRILTYCRIIFLLVLTTFSFSSPKTTGSFSRTS